MIYNTPADLITYRAETRTGFIEFALEKNKRATQFVQRAKSLHHFASKAQSPYDLKNILEIKTQLLTASGLSDKAIQYFTPEDKNAAIDGLIEKFLIPAGLEFVDELVYRYLLIKGDTLGGSMRNLIGVYAQKKLLSALLAVIDGIGYLCHWLPKHGQWTTRQNNDQDIDNIEDEIKGLSWINNNGCRTLMLNLKNQIVNKNIDLCLFDCNYLEFDKEVQSRPEKGIMFGELKGGIDPAGADEHWKTANTALTRIRNSFANQGFSVKTSFVGAAIEPNMAEEIFLQLQTDQLSYAANLTKSNQLYDYCSWLISL